MVETATGLKCVAELPAIMTDGFKFIDAVGGLKLDWNFRGDLVGSF